VQMGAAANGLEDGASVRPPFLNREFRESPSVFLLKTRFYSRTIRCDRQDNSALPFWGSHTTTSARYREIYEHQADANERRLVVQILLFGYDPEMLILQLSAAFWTGGRLRRTWGALRRSFAPSP
jgi:hypothetical protein